LVKVTHQNIEILSKNRNLKFQEPFFLIQDGAINRVLHFAIPLQLRLGVREHKNGTIRLAVVPAVV
jgi:hypothetical protein